ncbi:MAG: DUF1566 domain-containing protein, partial [Lachnospiraceae bacterium]|nr:DUF1566 domain-containing protein [Lachnospiraceae bacterium]
QCRNTAGATSFCGDGVVDSENGETCDEGANFNGQYGHCNADCNGAASYCGDGVVNTENGETCDDGEENGTYNKCNTTCSGRASFCSDGVVNAENGETCDLGERNGATNCAYGEESCTLCSSECRETAGITSFCGDGEKDEANGEACDLGTDNGNMNCPYGAESCLVCSTECKQIAGLASRCGDGVLDSENNEECDNGFANGATECLYGEESCTLCSSTCRETAGITSFCGDGATDAANKEECDNGEQNGATECAYNETECTLCTTGCVKTSGATSFCGDGRVDEANGETCDEGANLNGVYGHCGADCRSAASHCGDGVTDTENGETCDDGEENGSYGKCNTSCNGFASRCGDGILDTKHGEVCDRGFVNGATDCVYGELECILCSEECREVSGFATYCGDGAVQANEVCDKAESTVGEGGGIGGYCDDDCREILGSCGDGILQVNEVCDNAEPAVGEGDGIGGYCDDDCRTILGFCGDSALQYNELCDNGENNGNMDCAYGETECTVCSTECQPVQGVPSYCGDGKVDGRNGEVCDNAEPDVGDGHGIGFRCDETCSSVLTKILCTGQTKCSDGESFIDCPIEGEPFYGQDGQYAGKESCMQHEFVKGETLEIEENIYYEQVYDAATGLRWLVTPRQATYENAKALCENPEGYGGYTWRLPTIKELNTTIHLDTSYPAVREAFFSFNDSSYEFWSDTSISDAYARINSDITKEDYVLTLDFGNGEISLVNKTSDSSSSHVICVSGESYGATGEYTVVNSNGDEIVSDSSTNLLWQKGFANAKTIEQAFEYCENLNYAGYDDWRLPNRNEMMSLADYDSNSMSLTAFPDFATGINDGYYSAQGLQMFWTSTFAPTYGGAEGFFLFEMVSGMLAPSHGDSTSINAAAVRCVRSKTEPYPEGKSVPYCNETGFTPCEDPETGIVWSQVVNTNSDTLSKGFVETLCRESNDGGFSQWRIPTVSELRTILGNSANLAAGGACNVTDECSMSSDENCYNSELCENGSGFESKFHDYSYMISSTPTGDGDNYSWMIDLESGSLKPHSPEYIYKPTSSRCVLDESLPAAVGFFTDPETGLSWSRITGARDRMSAVKYCENLVQGGYDDWRIPTIDELATLVRNCDDDSGCEFSWDGIYSVLNDAATLWSSTLTEVNGATALNFFNFYTATQVSRTENLDSFKAKLRCVRSDNYPSTVVTEFPYHDEESGLWWSEKSGPFSSYEEAASYCADLTQSNYGGMSWDLPTLEDYATVLDCALPNFGDAGCSEISFSSSRSLFGDTETFISASLYYDSYPEVIDFSTGEIGVILAEQGMSGIIMGSNTSTFLPLSNLYVRCIGYEDACANDNPCTGIEHSTGECSSSKGQAVCVCDENYDWNGSECISFPYTDPATNIIWSEKSADTMSWDDAVSYCENLEEGGYNDWELPDIDNIRTLIQDCAATETGGSCGVTTSCSAYSGCWSSSGCQCSNDLTGGHSKFGDTVTLWSSTTESDYTNYAWTGNFSVGGVGDGSKSSSYNVRCVRYYNPCDTATCGEIENSDGSCSVNQQGGYDCGCENGYVWNGVECAATVCITADPCGEVENGNGNCESISLTEYSCGCKNGYFWNGDGCLPGPCKAGNPCGGVENSKCKSHSLTEYSCGCKSGYTWNGSECIVPLGRICTNQTGCYNNAPYLITCPAEGEDFFGQDAQYADLGKCTAQSFTVGTGTQAGTVIDNNTGLVWEQSPSEDTYTWDDAPNHCADLNSSNYGGISNWRVPNPQELISIINNNTYEPATNSNFTNIPTDMSVWFWTSAEYKGDTSYAYVFTPYYGYYYGYASDSYSKTKTYKVLCVSGEEMQSATSADFTSQMISGSVVVTDSKTGLMWQKEYATDITWQDALSYCEDSTYAGYSDWRLPNKNELLSLFNYEKSEVPYSYFPDMPSNYFWSSTTYAGNRYSAWLVDFVESSVSTNKSGSYHNNARCVREPDPCENNPCQGIENSDESCSADQQGGYTCGCESGYYWDGEACLPGPCITADPCNGVDNGNGTCQSYSSTDYVCGCNDGYFWNGEACLPGPCKAGDPCSGVDNGNGTCQSYSLTDYVCGCNDGYFWNGEACTTPLTLGNICTGQTKCYNSDGEEISCPAKGEDLYGQDPQYAALGTCTPQSFTVRTISGDNVVFDNNTGLQWQQSTTKKKYSWENAVSYCENLTYAGHSDWRLPSPLEIQTISDQDKSYPAFDTTYFPNITNSNSSRFWTSQERKVDTSRVYYVEYFNSFSSDTAKTDLYNVMCVRGSALPNASFTTQTISGADVVTDSTTGLMWQKTYLNRKTIWQDALEYCESLEYAGYSDWRLPNQNELTTLLNYNKTDSPYSDFPDMSDGTFWSSSTPLYNKEYAWFVDFGYGNVYPYYKARRNPVICVRTAQSSGQISFPYTDPETNLTWSSLKEDSDEDFLEWEQAFGYCENLEEGGYTDWRMPTIDELRTTVTNCPNVEPGGECGVYFYDGGFGDCNCDESMGSKLGDGDDVMLWSSTIAQEDEISIGYVAGVDFLNDNVSPFLINGRASVHCVRTDLPVNTQRYGTCYGLPEHGSWNSYDLILQTWNGSEWLPAIPEAVYSENGGDTQDCSFQCAADYIWTGSECIWTPCIPNPCYGMENSDGQCTADQQGGYSCGCNDGYEWNGIECVPISGQLPECGDSGTVPCTDSANSLSWSTISENDLDMNSAAAYCGTLNEGGSNNWRVPSVEELVTLVRNCSEGECEQNDSGYYSLLGDNSVLWSSTVGEDFGYFKVLDFGTASQTELTLDDAVYSEFKTRCVRTASDPLERESFNFPYHQTESQMLGEVDIWWSEKYGPVSSHSEAESYCASLTDGGLNWFVPGDMIQALIIEETPENFFQSKSIFYDFDVLASSRDAVSNYGTILEGAYFYYDFTHLFSLLAKEDGTVLIDPFDGTTYDGDVYVRCAHYDSCADSRCGSIPNSDGICQSNGASYSCGCIESYFWNGSSCIPETPYTDETNGLVWSSMSEDGLNWSGAAEYCLTLNEGGSDNWRVPTLAELGTLVTGCPEGNCDPLPVGSYSIFGDTETLWSSDYTMGNSVESAVFNVFDFGTASQTELSYEDATAAEIGVRCVRSTSDPLARPQVELPYLQEYEENGNTYNFYWSEKSQITTYAEAEAYCADLAQSNYGGISGWTVPDFDFIMLLLESGNSENLLMEPRGIFNDFGAFVSSYSPEEGTHMYMDFTSFGYVMGADDGSSMINAFTEEPYEGNVYVRCLYAADPCAADPCAEVEHWDGTCESLGGTDYSCGCADGYEWNGSECVAFPYTDPETDLVWSKRTTDFITWDAAVEYCENLEEGGYTDWRLPNIDELRTLIQNCTGSQAGGACAISDPDHLSIYNDWSDDCQCDAVYENGYYSKLSDRWYISLWSSSNRLENDSFAWVVYFGAGHVISTDKSDNYNQIYARCVRGEYQTQIDPCENNPCYGMENSDGQCTADQQGGYSCGCTGNHSWNGQACVETLQQLPECSPESDSPCTDSENSLSWSAISENGMNWSGAAEYCGTLNEGGSDNWRVPTVEELGTLVQNCPENSCEQNNSGYYSIFGDTETLWSSDSTMENSIESAIFNVLDFATASRTELTYTDAKGTSEVKVRCVRSISDPLSRPQVGLPYHQEDDWSSMYWSEKYGPVTTYAEAEAYCASLANSNYGGMSDWVVPEYEPLNMLVNTAPETDYYNSNHFAFSQRDIFNDFGTFVSSTSYNGAYYQYYNFTSLGFALVFTDDSQVLLFDPFDQAITPYEGEFESSVRCVSYGDACAQNNPCPGIQNASGECVSEKGSAVCVCNQGYEWNMNRECTPVYTDSENSLTWSSLAADMMDWNDAGLYCEDLEEGGYTDWRLPNIDELRTVIQNCENTQPGGVCEVSDPDHLSSSDYSSSCYCNYMEDNNGYYSRLGDDDNVGLWSSSTNTDNTNYAWSVYFVNAYVFYDIKTNVAGVRCVRGGEQTQTDPCNPDNPCLEVENSDGTCMSEGDAYMCGCEYGFEWDEETCAPATLETECTGLPDHAEWNFSGYVSQTWNGEDFEPEAVTYYSEYPEDEEEGCSFRCAANYVWNGEDCVETVCITDNPCAGIQNGSGSCFGYAEGYSCGCIDGYFWNGQECTAFPYTDPETNISWSAKSDDEMNWEEAGSYCEDLEDGGYDDWRLPTIDELRTIIQNCPGSEAGGDCAVSAPDHLVYSDGAGDCYCDYIQDNHGYYGRLGDDDSVWLWSSSALSDNTDNAWVVYFEDGSVWPADKTDYSYVRCVR